MECDMTSDVIMTTQELQLLTTYRCPCKQLEALKERGFHRAYRGRGGQVVLERSHYEAVSRGEASGSSRNVNLTFMQAC